MDPRQFEPTRQKRIIKLAPDECRDPSNLIILVGGNVAVAVTEDRIRLRSLKESWLSPGLRGRKEILIRHLTGVQFRKTGRATRGFIQFVYPGANEQRGGSAFDAVKDENTVLFDREDESDFEYLYHFVLHLMEKSQGPSPLGYQPGASTAEEVGRLHSLLQSGALTQAEFDEAKRRILSMSDPAPQSRPRVAAPAKQPGQPTFKPSAKERKPRSPGKVLAFCAFVLLVIWGIGSSLGSGDADSEPEPAARIAQGSISENTVAPSDDPGDIVDLNGVVVVHGDYASATEFGVDCRGVGAKDFIEPGVQLRVQAEGQAYLGPYELIHGRGNDEGACELPFGGEIHLSDSYQIVFEADGDAFPHQITTCSADETWFDDRMIFIQLHVYPDKTFAECVYPSHLD